MNFKYETDISAIAEILNESVMDSHCKHVMKIISGQKSERVYNESVKIGYKQVLWGQSYADLRGNYPLNRHHQISTIRYMHHDRIVRPVRIVIDTEGVPWVDNLHSTILQMILYGTDIKLSDMYCYIIDMRNTECITVYDKESSLSDSVTEIKGAIERAHDRIRRINDNIRSINYTVGDFLKDNELIGIAEKGFI